MLGRIRPCHHQFYAVGMVIMMMYEMIMVRMFLREKQADDRDLTFFKSNSHGFNFQSFNYLF